MCYHVMFERVLESIEELCHMFIDIMEISMGRTCRTLNMLYRSNLSQNTCLIEQILKTNVIDSCKRNMFNKLDESRTKSTEYQMVM